MSALFRSRPWRRCVAAVFLAALVPAQAAAETLRLEVLRSSWSVSFEAPLLKPARHEDGLESFYFYGNGGGSFNASLIVASPQCAGDVTSLDDAHACWSKVMAAKTGMADALASLSITRTAHYILASYFLPLRLRGQTVPMLHSHFIFAYGGKWADLHVSVVQPTEDDLHMLERLRTSFRYGKE